LPVQNDGLCSMVALARATGVGVAYNPLPNSTDSQKTRSTGSPGEERPGRAGKVGVLVESFALVAGAKCWLTLYGCFGTGNRRWVGLHPSTLFNGFSKISFHRIAWGGTTRASR
jgi:hypothetical protein